MEVKVESDMADFLRGASGSFSYKSADGAMGTTIKRSDLQVASLTRVTFDASKTWTGVIYKKY